MSRSVLAAGAVVVGHAVVQALLVIGDPVPPTTLSFTVRTIASCVAALVALVVLTMLVAGRGRPVAVLVAATSVLVLTVAGALVDPVVAGAVLVVGAAVVPAVALGPAPLRRVRRACRAHPVARGAWLVGTVVLVASTEIIGLFAGFLLGGAVATAAVAWSVDGAVAAVVLASATPLLRAGEAAVPEGRADRAAAPGAVAPPTSRKSAEA